MLSANDKNTGEFLKLQSFSQPPLKAGTYSLKTRLFNKAKDGDLKGMPDDFSGPPTLFKVDAPRFSIDIDMVHSVYPLAGSTGIYQEILPHIVLKRKTIALERTIGGTAGKLAPWLCLLLLTEDELTEGMVKEIEIKSFLIPDDTYTVVPRITLSDAEKVSESKAKVLEIDYKLFKKIVPLASELPFLSHNKQVDTTNKGNTEDNVKGWFASLICNRIPADKKTNHVFMVSLEGCGDYLTETNVPENDTRKLRLSVLHQWQFKDMGEKVEDVIARLYSNVQPLRVEVQLAGNNRKISKGVQTAIDYGYTPINHDRRTDDKSISWYRGPFVPLDIPHNTVRNYKNADQALRFDLDTSMFDISYAAAWQLGRLLALQDPGFSTALSNWKNAYKRDRPVQIAKKLMKDLGIEPDELAKLVKEVESDEVLTDYLIELWNSK